MRWIFCFCKGLVAYLPNILSLLKLLRLFNVIDVERKKVEALINAVMIR